MSEDFRPGSVYISRRHRWILRCRARQLSETADQVLANLLDVIVSQDRMLQKLDDLWKQRDKIDAEAMAGTNTKEDGKVPF